MKLKMILTLVSIFEVDIMLLLLSVHGNTGCQLTFLVAEPWPVTNDVAS